MLDTSECHDSRVPALEVVDLHKSYGATRALAGVDLRVEPGTILGLLGPNGAGKTSLVSIVAGLRRPDRGRVTLCGVDVVREPGRARPLVGLAPQDTGVYPTVTVLDNLRYFAELAGMRRREARDRALDVADALGLTALLGRRAAQLSGGERRRLHAAIALVHRPRVVLLDEPTTGADVRTRAQLLAMVRDLATSGSAVVYSTHYLHEIEELDAEVAFIDQGRIVAAGRPAELVAAHGASVLQLTFESSVPVAATVPDAVVDGPTVRIPTSDPGAVAARLLPGLGADADALRSVEILRPSLESVFLAVTGRSFVADRAADRVAEPAA
jgi:ABC-2 type transport system ATP-binding protein